MFDNSYSYSNARPRGALEVAIRARSQEKALALVVADYQTKKSSISIKKTSYKKGLIASFFAIFRTL